MELQNQINNFEKIPDSALDNTTVNIHEISDKDLFDTASIAEDSNNIGDTTTKEKKDTFTVNKSAQTTGTKLGYLVGGELAVRLLDIAMPALCVTVVYYIGYKLDRGKLKLTSDDKKVIVPLMQDALNAIEIDFSNPFINLAFGLSIVYGTKIIEEIPNITKRSRAVVKPLEQDKPEIPERKERVVYNGVRYNDEDFSTMSKPEIVTIAPEIKFRSDFDILIEQTRIATGRKSRRGCISYLYQYEKDKIKSLLDKYGFEDVPNDKDVEYIKSKYSSIDFTL